MRCKGIALVLIAALAASAWAGPTKFDPQKAADPAKFGKDVLKTDLKKLEKLNLEKLAILECFGEYVTSKEVTAGVAEQRSAARSAASAGRMFYTVRSSTSTLELDKDFYTNTSNRVYDAVAEAFENAGIAILSKAEILSNETYQNFNLEEEKSGRGATSGLFKDTVVEKSQKVSASGLGIFPGPIGMIKVVMKLGDVTAAIGAQGFMQIHFKVDKGKKDAPLLKSFEVLLSTDLRSQEVGFEGKKKLRYDFHTQWLPILKLEKELQSPVDVNTDGEFDVAKYDAALMDMLYAITDAAAHNLKEALNK